MKLFKHKKQSALPSRGNYNETDNREQWNTATPFLLWGQIVRNIYLVVWIKAAEGKLGLAYGGIKCQSYFQQGSFPVYLKPY